MKHLVPLILLTASALPAPADGVAVLKEQPFHRNLTARAVIYRRIIDSNGPWLRIVTARGNIDIGRSKLVDWMELPDGPPRSVTGEDDISRLREGLATMRTFAGRYPNCAALLAPEIAVAEAHVARFDSGEIRFGGIWMRPSERDRIQTERRAAEMAELRRQALAVQEYEEKKDEGLVLVDGRWMSREDAAKRSPVEPTRLSSAVWPLAKPDGDEAKRALARLDALAATQHGSPKIRTLRLHATLRNLFAAEDRYSRGKMAATSIAARAAKYERLTKEWMEPNAFGSMREGEARLAASKALDLRNDAGARLAESRNDLLDQLRETDLLAEDFLGNGEHRVALTLGETVRAIANRNFPNGTYQPVVADDALQTIRDKIAARRKKPEAR
ncbi:MAG: hypothetical protein H7A49_08750 [Akkermansiaceae bacterium]|nr:hypothetical protein [Akkermansiaceae bacterium]